MPKRLRLFLPGSRSRAFTLFQSRYRYRSVRMRTAGPIPGPPREAHPEGSRCGPGLPDIPPLNLGPGARAAQQAGRYFIRDRGEKGPWARRQRPAPPARQAAPHGRAGARTLIAGRGRRLRPLGRPPGSPPLPEDFPPQPHPVSLKTLGSESLGRHRHWPLRATPAGKSIETPGGSSPAFPRPTCSCV